MKAIEQCNKYSFNYFLLNDLVCSLWQLISLRADSPADLPRLARPPPWNCSCFLSVGVHLIFSLSLSSSVSCALFLSSFLFLSLFLFFSVSLAVFLSLCLSLLCSLHLFLSLSLSFSLSFLGPY